MFSFIEDETLVVFCFGNFKSSGEGSAALQNRISVSILKAGQVLPTEYYASVCAIATL